MENLLRKAPVPDKSMPFAWSSWFNMLRNMVNKVATITSIQEEAIATTATEGFLFVPTCAGTPTGVPTGITGRVALVYDTTNNKLYAYNGSWKSATFA